MVVGKQLNQIIKRKIIIIIQRSLSQRTSPTPSLRGGIGGRRRQEHYQYPSSSRPNPGRRGK
jgi:hypothetical protein